MVRRYAVGLLLIPTAALLGACHDKPVGPALATCPNPGQTLTLSAMNGSVACVPATSPGLQMTGGGARYLVVPQFPIEADKPAKTSFVLSAPATSPTASVVSTSYVAQDPSPSDGVGLPPQYRFELYLRRQESALAPEAQAYADEVAARRQALRVGLSPQSTTPPDPVKSFFVLKNFTADPRQASSYVTVTANLKYTGSHVIIYQDQNAPGATAGGFTDVDFQGFGTLFDQRLYAVDTAAFGPPSDLDQNGSVIVLLSPAINQLTPKDTCNKYHGYIAGYFFGNDLTNGTGSNKGEVFYSVAPDPNQLFSCQHTTTAVRRQTPVTFVHEFQHMINYNQKVLVFRKSTDETLWLNEGLSHIAEELGGRATPPDSAAPFLTGDYSNAYEYLRRPDTVSATTYVSSGSLPERGASWLFLRWLGDQKGDQIFKSLVQSPDFGAANVAARAGQSFEELFGQFGVAVYTDSMTPSGSFAGGRGPAPFRFQSLNLRKTFVQYLSNIYPSVLVQSLPIPVGSLSCTTSASGSMVQGTSMYYILDTTGCSAPSLRFGQSASQALLASLKPQAGVFRLQ